MPVKFEVSTPDVSAPLQLFSSAVLYSRLWNLSGSATTGGHFNFLWMHKQHFSEEENYMFHICNIRAGSCLEQEEKKKTLARSLGITTDGGTIAGKPSCWWSLESDKKAFGKFALTYSICVHAMTLMAHWSATIADLCCGSFSPVWIQSLLFMLSQSLH